MELPRPSWFLAAFETLLAGGELDSRAVTELMRDVLNGRADEALTAALVTALRIKGESAGEIAAAALALREQMTRLVPVSGPVVDTCGTGGDGSGTFNVSTAAALIAAGAGLPVVKHGNRAVSSNSGSADVLRELGVPIEAGPAWAQACLDRAKFAFCYAPQFHPGLSYVARLRRRLGVRTIFNLLGPLANPASADYQLLGVGRLELLDRLAGAAARLGVRRAILVHSLDGMDEVSLAAPTSVRIVEGGEFRSEQWQPGDFGLAPVRLSEIQADGPAESANLVRQSITDADSPASRLACANAGAALFCAGEVADVREGVARARQSVAGGAARGVLAELCV